ncbi:hypothetical protein HT031_000205 [Scenedesmus sp. PABB004]|nr:hypothetical protein HT031_000205 [Scenedesmus sp. PABB004]
MLLRRAGAARGPPPSGAAPPGGKGFGSPAKPSSGKGAGKQPGQQPDAAAAAAAAAAAKAPRVRPVDRREAARGKVDYVQVKDWVGGNAADLGELQVVPDSYAPAVYAAGGGAAAGAPARAQQPGGDDAGPFYQQLARHAQYLESQGALSLAHEPGAPPYRPFEAWRYELPAYCSYLAGLAAAHGALEAALTRALGPGAGDAARPGTRAALAALACFAEPCGLWRGAAAAADLAALCQLADAQQQAAARQASQDVAAYASYLEQLGRAAAAARQPGGGGRLAAEAEAEGASAALRLVAHAYALHVQQQALGTRIGAAASDALGLLERGGRGRGGRGGVPPGCALYLSYPAHVGEPVQQLVRATDGAGAALDAAGRQAVLDELPRALRKATLVLAPLAAA